MILRLGSATLALALGMAGCGGEDEKVARTTSRAPAPTVVDASELTCATIGGSKRYPGTKLSDTLHAANDVAPAYAEKFNQNPVVVAQSFATQILADCDEADNPSYHPIPALTDRANAAPEGASILTALRPETESTPTPTPTARKPERTPEPSAGLQDGRFVPKVAAACRARSGVAPLIARAERLNTDQGSRLGQSLAGLKGTLSGLGSGYPDRAAAAEAFGEKLQDLYDPASRLAIARKYHAQKSEVDDLVAEVKQGRAAARAAAGKVDAGKPIGACVALFS